jgi:hypothetical protein
VLAVEVSLLWSRVWATPQDGAASTTCVSSRPLVDDFQMIGRMRRMSTTTEKTVIRAFSAASQRDLHLSHFAQSPEAAFSVLPFGLVLNREHESSALLVAHSGILEHATRLPRRRILQSPPPLADMDWEEQRWLHWIPMALQVANSSVGRGSLEIWKADWALWVIAWSNLLGLEQARKLVGRHWCA